MFVSDTIPVEYDKIAEISDNYIVLVREAQLVSGRDYDAYYQFLQPSVFVLHVEDYRIKLGNLNENEYSYNSSGEVLSSEISSTLNCNTLETRENGFYDRFDSPYILFHQFFIVFLFVWVLNQISKLVKKGGVFTS